MLAAPTACQDIASGDASQTTEEQAEQYFNLFDEDAASVEFRSEKTGKEYLLVEQPLFRFSTEGSFIGTVYVWQAA